MFTLSQLACFSTSVLAFATAVLGGTHEVLRRRHAGTNYLERNTTLSKRFDNARFSFYEAGQGACGAWNTDNDFIVALNSAQFSGGSHCFETITISYKGKSTSAKIADECPGCPYGGLDLTPGLFSFFASEDAGIIYGEWDFGSGAAPPPPPPKPTPKPDPPKPKPSPTPSPEPTTSKVETTSSAVATSESSSAPQTSSASPSPSPSSESATPSPSSASAAATSATPAPTPTGTFDQLNAAFLGVVGLVVAAPGN